MAALASSDKAMSQREDLEKSSVMISAPRPGRISGVGALVDKAISVGVADGGNQFMVAVGSGVSVQITGVGMAFILSKKAHELPMPVMRIKMKKRRNIMRV